MRDLLITLRPECREGGHVAGIIDCFTKSVKHFIAFHQGEDDGRLKCGGVGGGKSAIKEGNNVCRQMIIPHQVGDDFAAR